MVFSKAKSRSTKGPFSIKMYSFEKGWYKYTSITKFNVKFTHCYGKFLIRNCLERPISENLTERNFIQRQYYTKQLSYLLQYKYSIYMILHVNKNG